MSNNNIENFKYLDNLIHSRVKEIVLDSDIVLGSDEKSQYLNGIKLDVDDLAIDGNGHAIDALGLTRIFYCTGKNVTIKNIILKNGFTKDDGGAIHNRGELTITEYTLQENTTTRDGGAIRNDEGELTITDSEFCENSAETWGGAIENSGELTMTDSTFTENTASDGGAMNNLGELTITDSTFTQNTATRGGAISNTRGGELRITRSVFTENATLYNGYGGAIYNVISELNITDCEFRENTADMRGGAI